MLKLSFSKKYTLTLKAKNLEIQVMFKTIFLQLGEGNAYDMIMKIGEFTKGIQETLAGFASNLFSMLGF
jgi:hypothetical protein